MDDRPRDAPWQNPRAQPRFEYSPKGEPWPVDQGPEFGEITPRGKGGQKKFTNYR